MDVRWLRVCQEILPAVMNCYIQVLPVIESGTLDIFIRKMKAKGTDKVERTPETHAESTDGTRVMGNFRFDKDYMEKLHIIIYTS